MFASLTKLSGFGFGVVATLCLSVSWPDLVNAQGARKQAAPSAQPLNWAQGASRAPVTILEYGSLTCGACAAFNNNVKPAIKRNYVDTGRARFVFRPFPTPPNDLSIAMHILTMCAGPANYYPLVDAFFARQGDIFEAARGETGPRNILFAISQDVGGMSPSQAETCLRDPQLLAGVRASVDAGNTAGVTGTPSVFINGTRFLPPAGEGYTIANVSAAIDGALRAVPRPADPPARKSPKSAKRATRK
jgi:protein-disulfide isomerase